MPKSEFRDQSSAAPTLATELRRLLQRVQNGNAIASRQAKALKAEGLVGETAGGLSLTAKGSALLDASQMATGGDGPIQLPDAMDRLANPRKGETALIETCDLAAARKFQSDLQRAGLRQRITQNWSLASLSHGGAKSTVSSARHEPISMLDARDRVNRACASIGPEFSGLLIDVCLFEKSLTGVERERQWPARSAKLAIALGLRALARHYGLTRTAQGAVR
jgi:hypothetical protein